MIYRFKIAAVYIPLSLTLIFVLIFGFSLNLFKIDNQVVLVLSAISVFIFPFSIFHQLTKGVLQVSLDAEEVNIDWQKKPLITAYSFPKQFNLKDVSGVNFNDNGLLYDMLTISTKTKQSLKIYRINHWPRANDQFFEFINSLILRHNS